MNIIIQSKNERPNVNVGDVLITHSGRKILLIKNENEKILALDLEDNILIKRVYEDVEDFLKSYSFSYIVHSANNIELTIKGTGKRWS